MIGNLYTDVIYSHVLVVGVHGRNYRGEVIYVTSSWLSHTLIEPIHNFREQVNPQNLLTDLFTPYGREIEEMRNYRTSYVAYTSEQIRGHNDK